MLKGKTTIFVSKAAAVAAFQMFFDATLKESHKIIDVTERTGSTYETGPPGFKVELEDEPPKEPSP